MSRNQRPLWKRDFDARRIETEVEALTPPRWHTKLRIGMWAAIAGGAYILLFRTSWGDDEHAFSALQRFGTQAVARFFKVDEEVPPIPLDDASSRPTPNKKE
jgi:hypothetical protein